MMDGEKLSMDIEAESLPSCYAVAWGQSPKEGDAIVAFSPTALGVSPKTLKDYADLTFTKQDLLHEGLSFIALCSWQ